MQRYKDVSEFLSKNLGFHSGTSMVPIITPKMINPSNFKSYPERALFLHYPCRQLAFDMTQLVLFSGVERSGKNDPFNKRF